MNTIGFPFCALILCVSLAWAKGADVSVLRPMRDGTELFVDDVNIAHQHGWVRTVHAAEKLGHPVLVADKPWERRGAGVYLYGTTHYDPATGEFRMWYGRAYATSRDGVNWTKPALDVETFENQPTNFVLPSGDGAIVIDEIEPDPAKRYKALAAEPIKVGGFSGYYSADGIHWTRYGTDRILTVGSEIGHMMRDPATKKYFAYIRPYPPRHMPKNVKEKRLGAVVTSDDFVNWSEMKVVLTPDAVDDAWVTRPEQRTEFYAMNGFAYGRSYLGVVPLFRIERIHEQIGRRQSKYDGPMEGQLITSRNGLDWQRMKERSPVIPSGTDFDQSIMNVAVAPIIVKDEVWHYYTAINGTHGAPLPPKRITIGLAKWRLDGYVSLDAGADEGVLETTAISDRSGPLQVNANAAGGRLVVEVLGADGQVMPGYAAADCTVLNSDNTRHLVRWTDHPELPADKAFRLRFLARKAALYSYTIAADGKPAAEAKVAVPKPAVPPTHADVAYGTHSRQVLDFWQAKSDRPAPLLFFIHGGGWVSGDKSGVSGILQKCLDAGISVVSINYRYSWQAQLAGVKPPVAAPLQDAARALQFVRSKAVEWNIDKQRIGASGGSAGACSSLWLAFHPDMADPQSSDPIARESTRLYCAAVNGAQTSLDPAQLKEWTPNSRYGGHAFGFMDPNDRKTRDTRFAEFLAKRDELLPWIKEYSPIEHVTTDDPPVCLIYTSAPAIGEPQKDPTHTSNYGVKLQEKCRSVGVDCELVYPGAPDVKHAEVFDYLVEKLK